MTATDKNIFKLIAILKDTNKIKSINEFCLEIGFLRQNIVRVREGKAHFTAEHIRQICKSYNINANWVVGLSANMFNGSSTKYQSINDKFSTQIEHKID